MIRRQLEIIRHGGPRVWLRKGLFLVGLVLALFLLPVVRALRPIVVIRFGQLVSHRIGPYASEPEVYLSELDVGMHNGRNIDVFYNESFISNYQLKKLWDRTLRVFQPARPVGMLNHWIPGGAKHEVPWRPYQQRDIYGVLPRTEAHLKFTEEEEEAGQAGLQNLSVPHGAPFVCFHARDSAFGESLAPGMDVGRVDYRNSDIQTYLPAVEELTRRGYFALRMGAVVEEPLKGSNPMIIDYATTSRTELLDLYLSAKCQFFVASPVGVMCLPMVFRRPTVYVNFVPIGTLVCLPPCDICIPKKFWLRDEGRFMTIREILRCGASMFARSYQYDQMSIELMDNTPEEISAAVFEMEERLKGTWQSSEEDEEFQRRFWNVFKNSEAARYTEGGRLDVPQARIGAQFLRENLELLA